MTTAFLVGRIIFGGYWLKGISPLQESRLHGPKLERVVAGEPALMHGCYNLTLFVMLGLLR